MSENGFKRNENGRFIEGTPPGPGRPKGQSLKEYWRQRFSEMTEQEKEQWTRKVAPEIIWRMAEGQPQQDLTSKGEKLFPQPIDALPTDNGLSKDSILDEED